MDSNDLEASVFHGEDDLRLLRSLPAECVDLAYLDSPFFSSWVHEGSRADRAEAHPPEGRWQGGGQAYLDWIAAPLGDLHRILKPSGALFLVCDEAVGPYVRLLLEELFNQRNVRNRMVWWTADSRPAHHHVFYFRESAHTADRNAHLYTVIHREGKDDSSLVAFSFLQGRPRPRVSNRRPAQLAARPVVSPNPGAHP